MCHSERSVSGVEESSHFVYFCSTIGAKILRLGFASLRMTTLFFSLINDYLSSYDTLTDLRMELMAPFSRRETWAWEMPRKLATSIWVLPS